MRFFSTEKIIGVAAVVIAAAAVPFMLAGCNKDIPAPTDTPSPTQSAAQTADASTVSPSALPTVAPTPTSPNTDIPTAKPTETPEYPSIYSKSGEYFKDDEHYTVRVDNSAYEISNYVSVQAADYAKLINDVGGALKGTTNVYDLIIPTSYGITLPDDIAEKIPNYIKMGECIEDAYSNLSDDVIPISVFSKLMQHRNEYIYFRTDHHWTALGAYYAYSSFCETKGIAPHELSDYKTKEFDGLLGSLYGNTHDENLLPAEKVKVYYPVCEDTSMTVERKDGSKATLPIITDPTEKGIAVTYIIFAGGDNPITVFDNPSVTDGSVLVLVKDSFGNALVPFLSDHYSKVYEVDYRYWKGNIIDFAKEVGADDLIFANNIMLVSTRSHYGKLSMIIK